jgi:hypothetical protein
MKFSIRRWSRWLFIIPVVIVVAACGSSNVPATANPYRSQEAPQGFFDRMVDTITERECNVGRFTCPYGLGPAGEPCDCTDPKGVVLSGQTIK